jgi:hypothetical protein
VANKHGAHLSCQIFQRGAQSGQVNRVIPAERRTNGAQQGAGRGV